MNELEDPEKMLQSTWSIGRLRPWLQLIAARELPDSLRGRIDESDVVQQTLLRAWNAETGFRGETHAERLAWLRAILKNTIRDQHRRETQTKRRGENREKRISDIDEIGDVGIDACAIAPDPTVSAQIIAAEETLALAEAIEELSDDQRQVVMMRHVDGLSHVDIAKKMGRSVAAVRMLWVRALQSLGKE